MRWRDLIGRVCLAPEGGGGDGGGGDGGGGGNAGDWLGGLPEDVRTHPEIAKFSGKGIADLAKEHINAQGMIGKKGVILPGEGASEEELGKFYNALGRPETADGYELKETDATDKDLVAWLRETAHKHGFTKAQAEKLYADWNARAAETRGAIAEATKGYETALRAELGSQFEAKMAAADETFKALLPNDEDRKAAAHLKLADGTYVLDHPILARAFMAAHELVGEDGEIRRGGGGGAPALNTPAGAQAEIDRIRAEALNDPEHAYNNTKHPQHTALHQKMNRLYEVVNQGEAA